MRSLGLATLMGIVIGAGSSAFASPYACTIVESGGVLTDVVQFSRSVSLSTDSTNYIVELTDYLGIVKVEIVDKGTGQVVLSQQTASDVPVAAQAMAPFKGLTAEVPGQLSVSCKSIAVPTPLVEPVGN